MPFTCNKKRDLGVSDFTKWKAQIMTPANISRLITLVKTDFCTQIIN
jgi:hypothetical protein